MELQQKNEGPTDVTLENWILCDEWVRQYVENRRREMKQDSRTHEQGKRKDKLEVNF